ncbi:hypothetical protein LIA77_09957 [Sarocladium implicatum]|nr:hypothetical protein LIA77_09957 [Sarocladium implicatum]
MTLMQNMACSLRQSPACFSATALVAPRQNKIQTPLTPCIMQNMPRPSSQWQFNVQVPRASKYEGNIKEKRCSSNRIWSIAAAYELQIDRNESRTRAVHCGKIS